MAMRPPTTTRKRTSRPEDDDDNANNNNNNAGHHKTTMPPPPAAKRARVHFDPDRDQVATFSTAATTTASATGYHHHHPHDHDADGSMAVDDKELDNGDDKDLDTSSAAVLDARQRRVRVQRGIDLAYFDAPVSSTSGGIGGAAGAHGEEDEDMDHDDDEEDDPDLDFMSSKRRRTLRDEAGSDEDKDGSDNDDDEDMFGDGETDEDVKYRKRKGKVVPLTREERLAQERSRGRDLADADDDNGGIAIEPFNMNGETREGGFTEEGVYVRAMDPNAKYDNWLTDVTDDDVAAAAVAQQARDQERAQHERAEEARLRRYGDSRESTTMALLGLLRPHETVVDALARLNRSIVRPARPKHNQKQQRSGASISTPVAAAEPIPSQWARADLALLTDLADRLLSLYNFVDVYEEKYEALLADLRDDGVVPRGWTPVHPHADERLVQWRYAWHQEHQPEAAAAEQFGPYSPSDMQDWAAGGFFEAGIVAQKLLNGVPYGDLLPIGGYVGADPTTVAWE
ncbi:hypothetical protein BC828DRAFT_386353 [Blastocladiella britannica]|nr:hypothetical protein BC828DRAFT_386353 [Blastocladiella britannica]